MPRLRAGRAGAMAAAASARRERTGGRSVTRPLQIDGEGQVGGGHFGAQGRAGVGATGKTLDLTSATTRRRDGGLGGRIHWTRRLGAHGERDS
ncbi:hypothetical protein GUJ93_ZPchr0008g13818 [Zizania palustris]|uniref:Uncharacterized protein n=1 Tax=Zizania palustris TaxID=103762 RepID=A0A8J5UWZ2_ZIZPA|nr:hypothetical protein GUJ93_ZPchr0008g13818 [Zizania palustris]